MPNWTHNTLFIEGSPEKLKIVSNMLAGVNGDGNEAAFSFNAIVPQTPEVEASLANNEGPSPYWYAWRVKNWGTKWDVNEIEPEDSGDQLVYRFDTAWDAPRIFYQALAAKLPEGVTMKAEAIHEDGQQYEEVCNHGS